MPKSKDTSLAPADRIESKIFFLRGKKIMFDFHLAELYEVETKVLNQAVKRNITRFPDDFMFQLSLAELENWRSQFVTSNSAAKMGLRRRPYAFTEQGVAMLSSVLKSDRAINVNIQIMRTFTRLRRMIASNKELREALEATDRKYGHEIRGVREDIKTIYKVLARLVATEESPTRQIGFQAQKKKPRR